MTDADVAQTKHWSTVPCGCGDYSVSVPEDDQPQAIDVVCPECGNHFGYGRTNRSPDDTVPPVEVLPNGADVELKSREDTQVCDRLEILQCGMVKLVNKQSYSMDLYPLDDVESISTYTKHVEDAEWW